MRQALVALLSGLLFGVGLVVSGMADPRNVLAFLTLGQNWDPSLMLVMGSALAIALPSFQWLRRRSSPWLAGTFAGSSGGVDGRLLAGASLFGAGWGLAGYCPGPALVGLSLGQEAALVFVPAMLAGAWIARRL